MAKRLWIFLINTFYVNTVESIKNAISFTQDHLAKLTANESDPDILSIKTFYLPLHDAFLTAYNQLQSKLGLYHGKTQTFEELLEELAKLKINQWRGQVFAIFPEGSADAHAIFPQDRQLFTHGTYDQRVEAVKTLSLTLATYTAHPSLVTLSTAVNAHHIVLTGARALQQTDEGSTETLRSNLKLAHKDLCDGLYKNLGLLMAKYYTQPEVVANYFDLTLLRRSSADEGNGGDVYEEFTIAPAQIITIGEAPASDDVEAEVIHVSGNGNAVFCTAPATDSPCVGNIFTLAPGQVFQGTYGEMNISGNPYVRVSNTGTDDLVIRVRVVEP